MSMYCAIARRDSDSVADAHFVVKLVVASNKLEGETMNRNKIGQQ